MTRINMYCAVALCFLWLLLHQVRASEKGIRSSGGNLASVKIVIPASGSVPTFSENGFLTLRPLGHLAQSEPVFFSFVTIRKATVFQSAYTSEPLRLGNYAITVYPFASPVYGDARIPGGQISVQSNTATSIDLPPLFSIKVRLPTRVGVSKDKPGFLIITGKERPMKAYRMPVRLEEKDGTYEGEWQYAIPDKSYEVVWFLRDGFEQVSVGVIRLRTEDILNGELAIPREKNRVPD